MVDSNNNLDETSDSKQSQTPARLLHIHQGRMPISQDIENPMRDHINEGMQNNSISKDWIEKLFSTLDNKIDLDKVKSDSRFDRIVSESNARFDKLDSAIKFESEKNSLKIESAIAKSESNISKWLIGIILTIIFGTVGTVVSVWKLTGPPTTQYYEKNQTSYTQPASVEPKSNPSTNTNP